MDKPPRTFWQIWNMSFGFLGVQFGWGMQMANISAIYEYLGARADQIPLLWLAAMAKLRVATVPAQSGSVLE